MTVFPQSWLNRLSSVESKLAERLDLDLPG